MLSTLRRTVTCGACGQLGHTKRSKSCPQHPSFGLEVSIQSPKVQTEDLGKIFEKAICDLFAIPFDGPYKYTSTEQIAKCAEITAKLRTLTPLVPAGQIKHTAENGARYDFTISQPGNTESDEKHLSAKTSKKKDGKVAPQVIGQPSPAKFCELVGAGELTIPELKQYIQTPENTVRILQLLFDYTFSCPVVYYNEAHDDIKYIKSRNPIGWSSLTLEWTRPHEHWSNSSTLRVKKTSTDNPISLVEFQFHTKRKNMAIRWCFENLLTLFCPEFEITQIHQKTNPSPVQSPVLETSPVQSPVLETSPVQSPVLETSPVQSPVIDLTAAPVKKSQPLDCESRPKRELDPKRLDLGH